MEIAWLIRKFSYHKRFKIETYFRQLEKSETCEFGCYTKIINNYNAETEEIILNEVSIERGCNQKKGISLQAGCKVIFLLDKKS